MKKRIYVSIVIAILINMLYAVPVTNNAVKYLVNETNTPFDIAISYDNDNVTEPQIIAAQGPVTKDSPRVVSFPAQWPGSTADKGYPTKVTIFYPSASASTAFKVTLNLPKPSKEGTADFRIYKLYLSNNELQQIMRLMNQLQSNNAIQGE